MDQIAVRKINRTFGRVCNGLAIPFLLAITLGAHDALAQDPGAKTVSIPLATDKTVTLDQPLGAPDYKNMTGFVPNASLPIEEPSVLWAATSETVDLNGNATAYPITDAAVADGVLYFGDDRGALIAFRIHDQTEVWRYNGGSRISTTPAVDTEFVYFGSKTGVKAVHRENGAVIWNFGIEHGADESTPIPIGDKIFASGYDGHSYCLNRANGEVVWKHNFVEDAPPDQPGFEGKRARFQEIAARPNGSACDGQVFVQCIFDQSRVIALDCATGKRRWSFQSGGWIGPAPTIADGRVYVASQDKHLYCLDLNTGTLVWKYETPSWNASRPAIHDGKVYLPHHGAMLFQLKADSGELIRTFEPPDEADRKGLVYSFPLISNATAYFTSGSGLLFAVKIETGELRWKIRPSEDSELFTSPVTDGQRIFVTSRQANDKSGECAIIAVGIED